MQCYHGFEVLILNGNTYECQPNLNNVANMNAGGVDWYVSILVSVKLLMSSALNAFLLSLTILHKGFHILNMIVTNVEEVRSCQVLKNVVRVNKWLKFNVQLLWCKLFLGEIVSVALDGQPTLELGILPCIHLVFWKAIHEHQ